LIRPADMRRIFKTRIPLVISSIYHDYSEYDAGHRSALPRSLYRLFGKFGLEYLKTIGRWLNGSDNFPGLRFLLRGQKRSMQDLLRRASFLITTSEQELAKIKEDLNNTLPA